MTGAGKKRKKLSAEHKRKISENNAKYWLGKKRPELYTPKEKIKHSGGYILFYNPNHPKSDIHGRVLEHRIIMERNIGRMLLDFEVVHHVNGIKDDNRIENLELMDKSTHASHHSKEPSICKVEGCNCRVEGLGLCNKHYIGYRRGYKKYSKLFENMGVL